MQAGCISLRPYFLILVRVSRLSVENKDENLFPLTKPLIFLSVLAIIYTAGLSILALHSLLQQAASSRVLWSIAFGLILTWWIYTDRPNRNFKLPFEFEYFVLFAWPIVVPYYLYRRLGWRGLLLGLGIFGLYVGPYFMAAFIYAVEQVYGSR
jgi:hypothetical protein